MRRLLAAPLLLALILGACDLHDPQATPPPEPVPDVAPRVAPSHTAGKSGAAHGTPALALAAYLDAVNAELAAAGLGVAVQKAEWVGRAEDRAEGQTVFANDRTLRLESQWVPGDARRDAQGPNLTHVVDATFAMANTFNLSPPIPAEAAIDASFATWDAVRCAALDIDKRPDVGINYSGLLTVGGQVGDPFYADISTVGFIPGSIFDTVLGPGASESVLGVTFTSVFIDPATGQPTDVDGDGYSDVAFKEVWYNDALAWSTDGGEGEDVETVALHENGHALGLEHFGRISITGKNGKLHVAPRAVMNAIILGLLRDPLGTDNGAYCGLYASWPS